METEGNLDIAFQPDKSKCYCHPTPYRTSCTYLKQILSNRLRLTKITSKVGHATALSVQNSAVQRWY